MSKFFKKKNLFSLLAISLVASAGSSLKAGKWDELVKKMFPNSSLIQCIFTPDNNKDTKENFFYDHDAEIGNVPISKFDFLTPEGYEAYKSYKACKKEINKKLNFSMYKDFSYENFINKNIDESFSDKKIRIGLFFKILGIFANGDVPFEPQYFSMNNKKLCNELLSSIYDNPMGEPITQEQKNMQQLKQYFIDINNALRKNLHFREYCALIQNQSNFLDLISYVFRDLSINPKKYDEPIRGMVPTEVDLLDFVSWNTVSPEDFYHEEFQTLSFVKDLEHISTNKKIFDLLTNRDVALYYKQSSKVNTSEGEKIYPNKALLDIFESNILHEIEYKICQIIYPILCSLSFSSIKNNELSLAFHEHPSSYESALPNFLTYVTSQKLLLQIYSALYLKTQEYHNRNKEITQEGRCLLKNLQKLPKAIVFIEILPFLKYWEAPQSYSIINAMGDKENNPLEHFSIPLQLSFQETLFEYSNEAELENICGKVSLFSDEKRRAFVELIDKDLEIRQKELKNFDMDIHRNFRNSIMHNCFDKKILDIKENELQNKMNIVKEKKRQEEMKNHEHNEEIKNIRHKLFNLTNIHKKYAPLLIKNDYIPKETVKTLYEALFLSRYSLIHYMFSLLEKDKKANFSPAKREYYQRIRTLLQNIIKNQNKK